MRAPAHFAGGKMNKRQLVMAILTFLFNVASVILEEMH